MVGITGTKRIHGIQRPGPIAHEGPGAVHAHAGRAHVLQGRFPQWLLAGELVGAQTRGLGPGALGEQDRSLPARRLHHAPALNEARSSADPGLLVRGLCLCRNSREEPRTERLAVPRYAASDFDRSSRLTGHSPSS